MVSLRTGLPVKNVKMEIFNPAIEDFTRIDVCAFPAKGEKAEQESGVYTIFEDITALNNAERSLKSTKVKLESALATMSERKTEQEALATLAVRNRALHQAVSDGIHVLDEQGHLVEVNDAFCRMLGYSEEEILRLNIADFDEQWPKEELDAKLIKLVREHINLPVTFETRHRSKDGTIRDVEINGISVILEGKNYLYASARDITDRKQTEKVLRIAKEAAESAVRAKSAFFAMMTHELRTPLNGVMGFSELLSETQLNEEQREHVESINSSGEHLLGIINDILYFSSMENGRLQLHCAPFSMAEILEASMLSVRTSALEKGLELRAETGSCVSEQMSGDERRVRQILINLLGNAVKFTSKGSIVLRVAASTAGSLPAVEFSVEDTGLGISAETLDRIFEPFTQANSTIGSSFGGTGLGLSVSRRLAEAMNGTITVESTLGKGSIFTLRIPLENPVSLPSIPSPAVPLNSEPAAPEGNLILVVDDDRASGVVAVKMLQNLGYQVGFVTNGAEAIEVFLPGKYSAILMDVAMPVMDGIVATSKIRALEAMSGYHVSIIAFTANAMIGDRERCLASGMDDFLSKPFRKEELAKKLASIAHRQAR